MVTYSLSWHFSTEKTINPHWVRLVLVMHWRLTFVSDIIVGFEVWVVEGELFLVTVFS